MFSETISWEKKLICEKLVSLKSRSLILNAFQTSLCKVQKEKKCRLFDVVYTDSCSSFCVVCYEHIGQCCIRDTIDPAPQVFRFRLNAQWLVPRVSAGCTLKNSAFCGQCISGLVRKIAKSDYWILPSARLSAGTTRLPVDGFSWNLTFDYFPKICGENSRFAKIWQE